MGPFTPGKVVQTPAGELMVEATFGAGNARVVLVSNARVSHTGANPVAVFVSGYLVAAVEKGDVSEGDALNYALHVSSIYDHDELIGAGSEATPERLALLAEVGNRIEGHLYDPDGDTTALCIAAFSQATKRLIGDEAAADFVEAAHLEVAAKAREFADEAAGV